METNAEEGQKDVTVSLLPESKTDSSSPNPPVSDKSPEQPPGKENPAPAPAATNVGFGRLWAYSKRNCCNVMLGNIFMVLTAGAVFAGPKIMGKLLDAIATKDEEALGPLTLTYLVIAVGCGFTTYFKQLLYSIVEERVIRDVREDLFKSVVNKDVEFFDDRKTGELMSRMGTDTTTIKTAASTSLWNTVYALIQLIGYLILLFSISWKLTLILLGCMPFIGAATYWFIVVAQKIAKKYQDDLAECANVAEEAVSNIRVVKSFGSEEKEFQAYKAKVGEVYKTGLRQASAVSMFMGSLALIFNLLIIIALYFGGKFVFEGDMTIGDLGAYIMYTISIGMASATFSGTLGGIMTSIAACTRVFEIMDFVPKIVNKMKGAIIPAFRGQVGFDNVTFHYPSKPDVSILKSFSVTVNPGEVVAVVGSSGSGKSTIISLIERFYDPKQGKILFDNQDIKELDLDFIHKHVGLVSQEPILFSGTIEQNIAYGVENYTQEDLDHAAKLANAYDFIHNKDQFPEEYKTLVGEKGVKLSGGQKQRIAIARALIKNPKILIFDEATSALDAESESQVQVAIDKIISQCETTMLIIAHRLSTIIKCKRILVLQNGQVVEQGNHDDLISQGGAYKTLMEKQLQGYRL